MLLVVCVTLFRGPGAKLRLGTTGRDHLKSHFWLRQGFEVGSSWSRSFIFQHESRILLTLQEECMPRTYDEAILQRGKAFREEMNSTSQGQVL